MSDAPTAVLLMAPPQPGADLERVLGAERVAELQAWLRSQAETWAREFAGDEVHHAASGEPLAGAINRIFAGREGPLLAVWPWLPRLRPEHAAGALDDLGAGCDVVLGPVIGGGLYLLGLARPPPELLALPEERWLDPDVMAIGFAAAREAGLEVGVLRAERALRSAGDLRAALADPLLPEELRRILDYEKG